MALESLVLDGLSLNAAPVAATGGYSTEVLADSPSLYWRLGESVGTTAADASGNARTGTYGSSVTLNQTGAISGDANTAVLIGNDSNGVISTTYNPFVNGASITVECWAKRASATVRDCIFASSGANAVQLTINSVGGDVMFDANSSAGSSATWTAALPLTGTFYHVALTFNESTDTAELFINGVSQGTKSVTDAYATTGNIQVGQFSTTFPNLGSLQLDEFAIYSSVLSSSRIAVHAIATGTATVPSAFRLQGYDVTPPAKRQEWAQGADTDGALLVRDPLFENREITLRLRLRQQTTMDLALAQIATLSKKLEEAEQQPDGLALVWTPAGSANSVTFYVLSGTVDGLPIELSGDDAGWFLRAPVITVKLQCKPHWYGTPVTFGAVSSATPFVVLTLAAVGGDAPAEGRLQITDAATKDRCYIEWGLEWRYYDAATSLLVDSDDMVTSGFSGAQTTRSGAYDPNASGNNVIRGTLFSDPLALCSTGNLGHVGAFRVKARVYASAAGQYARLNWQEGDGPFRSNPYAVPAVVGAFSEVDLGLVTIPPKQLGTQRWSGRVEAYTTGAAGTDTLDVDYLVLVPAAEGYGKARAQLTLATPTTFTARDEFNQAPAVLAGQAMSAGGTWSGAGDTDDFSSNSGTANRTAVSDASTSLATGRLEIAGTTTLTNTLVGVSISTTGTLIGTVPRLGVLARYTDTNNFLLAMLVRNNATGEITPQVYKRVASVETQIDGFADTGIGVTFGTPMNLRLLVTADGRFAVWVSQSTAFGDPIIVGSDTALATGGALASGKVGMYDRYTAGGALTRTYDNFAASVPDTPTALYSGKTAEIRYDGAIRQDSTGTYYGPVPSYRGSRFFAPAAGDENRTSRILVKAHRNDIEAAPSDNVTDNLTVAAIVTPRGIVVPF
jgi:hypothetical protein